MSKNYDFETSPKKNIFRKIIDKIATSFKNLIYRFRKLFHFSLSFKISAVYGLTVTIVFLIISSSIFLGFRYYLINQSYQTIKKHFFIINTEIRENRVIPYDKIEKTTKYDNIVVSFFDSNQELIFTTAEDEDITFSETTNTLSLLKSNKLESIYINNKVYFYNEYLYLQLSMSVEPYNFLSNLLFILLIATNLLGIIIILIIGFRICTRMLYPITNMNRTAKAITAENLDTRLDINSSYDELRELAITFNQMIDRLQSSYDKQNQFVSDASHELRTPISVIQGYVNMLDRWGKDDMEILAESIDAIKEEASYMKELIEKLLFLTRSDKNLLSTNKTFFNLKELTDEIVYETNLIDEEHIITSDGDQEISLFADRTLIKQTLRIFVDNSVKFTPKGGSIAVNVTKQEDSVDISIKDSGAGIPEEDIPFIFNRFYRSDKSRTKKKGGHGLGLAIANLITTIHNGNIKVNSTLGIGTEIIVNLPIK